MGRVTKYDVNMQCRILEYAALGYNLSEIAALLKVSRNTLHRWIKIHDLKRHLDTIDQDLMRGTIKRGLIALAKGVKIEDETIKFVEEDDAGRPVEITRRTKLLPPSEKAIQILARRYEREFSDALEDDSKHKSITHDINVNIMSQRELNELRKLNPLDDAVDAECRELNDPDDTERLDSPPSKGSSS